MGQVKIIGAINPNVRELAQRLDAAYLDALKNQPELWWKTVAGFTSTQEVVTKFPIDLTNLGPGFRKFAGERDVKDKDWTSFVLESEPFERTVAVPLDIAKSPGFGPYVAGASDIAPAAEEHKNMLVAAVLQAGKTTAKCWDGQPLFSASHPINMRDDAKGTWSNLHTSKPFTRANFAYAKTQMRARKSPDGKSTAGQRLTVILAPTDLEDTIDELFNKRLRLEAGAEGSSVAADDNIYYQGAIKVIAPELDNEPGVWYALSLGRRARPVELQFAGGGEPEIVFLGDGSEHAVMKNEVVYAAKMFGGAGAAHPHVIDRYEP